MKTCGFAAMLLVIASAIARPVVFQPAAAQKEDPQAKAARTKYDAAVKKATKDYEAAVERIRQDTEGEFKEAKKIYLAELLNLELGATKSGDLNRAVTLRALRQEAEELPVTADGGPVKWRPGAVVFKGVQYRVFLGRYTWDEARKMCKKLGGDLAVLDTPEKRAFLGKEILDAVVQVGAYRDNQGKWVWVNGKPVGKDAWAPGRPDAFGPRGHFFPSGHVGDGTDGVPHEHVRGYVCEWPK